MKAKKRLNRFDKTVLIFNAITALTLLLSYLAPGTDPRDFSFIAILGFGYLILLALNIVFAIYWPFRAKALFSLISLIPVLLGFTFIKSYFGFNSNSFTDKKPSEQNIRLMAYNVNNFEGYARDAQAAQNEILDFINQKQPDIINFEEYLVNNPDKDPFSDSLKKVLKSNYFYFKGYTRMTNGMAGNAIFSKLPVIKFDTIPAPPILNTKAIFIDVKQGNKIFRIYCIHLAYVNVGKAKGKYLKGTVDLGKTSFIENRLSSAFVSRSLQVERIKRHAANCPYPYIIAGDFNDTPISYAVNELGDGLKNAFAEKGHGFTTTYYSRFPLQIDHILVSQQFDVLSYQAFDKKTSDHKPIICDLQLN